jgi:hypothetical protein
VAALNLSYGPRPFIIVKRSKTCFKLVRCDWKSLHRTNMSSRKANTVFEVKPRRTKFITLAYVPGALHNPKLILTHSKSPNFVVNAVFFYYLLVLFLPANIHYWHYALSTRCFRPKYPDILQLTARGKHPKPSLCSKHGSLCTIVLHRLVYGLMLEQMPTPRWRVE